MNIINLNSFDKFEILTALLEKPDKKNRMDLARLFFLEWAEKKNYEDTIENLNLIVDERDRQIQTLTLALVQARKKKAVSE